MISLKTRLEAELFGRKPEEVLELNLDNSRASEIEGLTDEFINLETLSLINVGLQTLNGLPHLPSLKKIELSDNRISGGLNTLVECCPNLEQLALSGNRIKDIQTLASLASLKNLRNLDLFNCEVSDLETYREDVFTLIPALKYLDGFDKNQCEIPEDEEEEPDGSYEPDEADSEEEFDEGSEASSDENVITIPNGEIANTKIDYRNGLDAEDGENEEFDEEEDDDEWDEEGDEDDEEPGIGREEAEEEYEDYEEYSHLDDIEEASNDQSAVLNRAVKRTHECDSASGPDNKILKNGDAN